MPQASKFSGLFQNRVDDEAPAPGRSEQAVVPKAMGRPPGKRSNPDFKPRTVLMRDQLHLEVTDILRHQKERQDMSDLINVLLENWVKTQKTQS
jgi:hypothetical protein